MLTAVFVSFGINTILAMPPGLVPLQDVFVAKGAAAPLHSTDEISSAQMSDGVVRGESLFLIRISFFRSVLAENAHETHRFEVFCTSLDLAFPVAPYLPSASALP
jgi:hypothetical protein